ncbi:MULTISPECIES: universal stress protein [Cryobacterium]|uniref:universal stress protein n=1 Tax=Cryobacterium TaxID=69578 RepID=UPI000CD3ED73|nr:MULTISPECIES: universal stress protein [Cryobacterium]POH63486.1 universal stress protein [Cryobacterium zongtaii]TFC42178.1 universal stress protein [Cryobacterium sp. TMN-39-2]
MSIRARVVVGVYPGQADGVVLQAAVFAARFDAELVCAWVDPGRHPRADHADAPTPGNGAGVDPYLTAHLTRILGGHDIEWSTRQLSGDPARALGQLAETLRAVMIVVGTRDGTVRGSLQEFFAGSIAMHLAHRQHRPVVVVPLSPVSFDDDVPWESE